MQKQKFDEIVSYFNKKVSEMEIETKYKMELLGMVTALGCAHEKETHEERTKTHACENTCESERKSNDMISRADALNVLGEEPPVWYDGEDEIAERNQWRRDVDAIKALPSAQPTYTDEQIQKMQDLESAEIEKAYQLGYEEGKRDAQPEPKEIGYGECANAMLKMWIDNVLTDGEYNRIMDKLNKHWGKDSDDNG